MILYNGKRYNIKKYKLIGKKICVTRAFRGMSGIAKIEALFLTKELRYILFFGVNLHCSKEEYNKIASSRESDECLFSVLESIQPSVLDVTEDKLKYIEKLCKNPELYHSYEDVI